MGDGRVCVRGCVCVPLCPLGACVCFLSFFYLRGRRARGGGVGGRGRGFGWRESEARVGQGTPCPGERTPRAPHFLGRPLLSLGGLGGVCWGARVCFVQIGSPHPPPSKGCTPVSAAATKRDRLRGHHLFFKLLCLVCEESRAQPFLTHRKLGLLALPPRMPTFKSGDDSPPSSSVPWGMPAPAEGGSPVLGAPAAALTTSVSAEKGAPMEPSKADQFAGAGASTLELAPLEPLSMIFHNLRYSVSNRKGALAILKSVSGHALHSRLTALLGPSGAGKVRPFRGGWGGGEDGGPGHLPRLGTAGRGSEGGDARRSGCRARGPGPGARECRRLMAHLPPRCRKKKNAARPCNSRAAFFSVASAAPARPGPRPPAPGPTPLAMAAPWAGLSRGVRALGDPAGGRIGRPESPLPLARQAEARGCRRGAQGPVGGGAGAGAGRPSPPCAPAMPRAGPGLSCALGHLRRGRLPGPGPASAGGAGRCFLPRTPAARRRGLPLAFAALFF